MPELEVRAFEGDEMYQGAVLSLRRGRFQKRACQQSRALGLSGWWVPHDPAASLCVGSPSPQGCPCLPPKKKPGHMVWDLEPAEPADSFPVIQNLNSSRVFSFNERSYSFFIAYSGIFPPLRDCTFCFGIIQPHRLLAQALEK